MTILASPSRRRLSWEAGANRPCAAGAPGGGHTRQVGPRHHANLVGRRKPHAVVVMLDCSTTLAATVRWLCLFCNSLDTGAGAGAPTRPAG